MRIKQHLAKASDMALTVDRLASEIAEKENMSNTVLVGIKTRGVPLARRLAALIEQKTGLDVPVGELDITFYRDDLSTIGEAPTVKGSNIPFSVVGKTVILCDDVLYTGRTVRAAMDELLDYGRFARLKLCVLVDRGWRELPVCPDYTGYRFETSENEAIEVKFKETDGRDEVLLVEI